MATSPSPQHSVTPWAKANKQSWPAGKEGSAGWHGWVIAITWNRTGRDGRLLIDAAHYFQPRKTATSKNKKSTRRAQTLAKHLVSPDIVTSTCGKVYVQYTVCIGSNDTRLRNMVGSLMIKESWPFYLAGIGTLTENLFLYSLLS